MNSIGGRRTIENTRAREEQHLHPVEVHGIRPSSTGEPQKMVTDPRLARATRGNISKMRKRTPGSGK
jgi:hypothetical protein